MAGFRKVIVIGLDGLDPRITERLMARGALPHLARLRQRGAFAPVATTYPAQTPVAWSTFATGTNPGGHGIFDFIRRDPATYRPDLALNRYEQKSSFLPPSAVNLRGGVPVWELLGQAGVPSVVLRCPCTYPPDKLKGRMLSGMGVPDVRGGLGTSTLYAERRDVTARESEQIVLLEKRADGGFTTFLVGPRNPRRGKDSTCALEIEPRASAGAAILRSSGDPAELEVRLGEWSAWLRIRFKLGTLQSAHGIVRVHLNSLDPFELYASPVNFDPDSPLFPISAPWDYAGELERRIGLFHTTGMAEDHGGLINERIDEHAFLRQCDTVMAEREAMLGYELDRFREGFVYCLFDTPDRIQHMFWRFQEPGHPANAGRAVQAELETVIEDHYRRCDALVGRVLEGADADTLLVALSDHGFTSFQRGFHANTWLLDNGYLALKPGLEPGPAAGDLLEGIDWPRTSAYAVGLGSIYLNVAGREAEGTVDPASADRVGGEIAARLRGLADPERGAMAVRDVKLRREIWRGPHAADSPDLLLLFAEGYRVSWETGLGGVGRGWFEDNVRKWSGDHIIDPPLIPGVLFMNRPFATESPALADLAPTILDALGVPAGEHMEGTSLLP
ncbi:MAG TPA: alkaline phosphatase family protein [Gemmatimonadota bacterium]|nr:alkaline phosphatase family protein [Gemmatimonadota bacterium]